MELEQLLHMNGGGGERSYASNSAMPRALISMLKPLLEESLLELCSTVLPDHCLKMADLGCSAGPNTFLLVSQFVDVLIKAASAQKSSNKTLPSLQAFLNDLPGNDFNTVFKSWPSFYKRLKAEKGNEFGNCFVAGVPGSFYSRLFPDNSMHFFYSSYALMWLSEPPKVLNEGNICIAKTSPPAVFKSYWDQYQTDFTLFLKYRAEELTAGGRMFLNILGRNKSDTHLLNTWEVLGLILHDMVLEGIVEKEKLDTFNLPCYGPTTEEIKSLVEKEGSFTVLRLQGFETNWDAQSKQAYPELVDNVQARTAIVASTRMSVFEPILASHFGYDIMDDLFHRFQEDLPNHMEKLFFVNVVISLAKKA